MTVRTKLIASLMSFGAVFAVASCSLFDAANLGTGGFEGGVQQGIVFDEATRLGLDIYRPAGPGPNPTVVFFYGGSWDSGQRQDYRFVGVELARRGFTVVIPDYRKYPDVTFPAFVEDAAKAVAWVRSNIAEHGGDPARLVAMGHSAGAHSVMLLATDARYLGQVGLEPADLKGVIGLAGPYNFTPKTERFVRTFGGPENFEVMKAETHVDGDEPPIVMLHGLADSTVSRVNVASMVAALERSGGCYATEYYEGVGHLGIVGAFSWAFGADPIVSDVARYARVMADGTLCAKRAG